MSENIGDELNLHGSRGSNHQLTSTNISHLAIFAGYIGWPHRQLTSADIIECPRFGAKFVKFNTREYYHLYGRSFSIWGQITSALAYAVSGILVGYIAQH